MDSEIVAPSPVFYAHRVTVEEYDQQTKEYTRKKLMELAHAVRRKPEVAASTLYYKQKNRQFHKTELIISLFISIGIGLWACSLLLGGPYDIVTPPPTNESLCVDISSRVEGNIVFPIAVLVSVFVLWLTSKELASLVTGHSARFGTQLAEALLAYTLPVLYASLAAALLNIMAVSLYGDNCAAKAGDLLLSASALPFTSSSLNAAALSGTKAAALLGFEERQLAFISLAARLVFLLALFRAASRALKPRNTPARVVLALYLVSAGTLMLLPETVDLETRGKWFLLAVFFGHTLGLALSFVQDILDEAKDRRRAANEPKEDVDDEVEEEEEEEVAKEVHAAAEAY